MSDLEVVSITVTPIVKFIWTLKEVIVISFTLANQSHELELLHVKYAREVFVLLDQRLICKLNRRELETYPAKVEVGGLPLLLSYQDGKFNIADSCSMMTVSTHASEVNMSGKKPKIISKRPKEIGFPIMVFR